MLGPDSLLDHGPVGLYLLPDGSSGNSRKPTWVLSHRDEAVHSTLKGNLPGSVGKIQQLDLGRAVH